jgi:hypothetical protein
MTRGTRLALLLFAAALALSGAGAAHGLDMVVLSTRPSPEGLPEAELLALGPVTNVLPPPDTSDVTPETEPMPYPAGVMTRHGPLMLTPGRAFGSFGIPYATTRVQEGNESAGATGANRLSTTAPYRAIGKLTFSAGYCSASLIRRSVIVTAAHCVQNFGSGGALFTNFQFRPGHWGAPGATATQIAPYGTWKWIALVRPDTWANGTDIGTGAARDNDVAVLALGKNAKGRFVGDITGYLNYAWNNYSFVASSRTGNLQTGAVSTLGYPALMDGGAIMQRTDGPAYTTTLGGAGQLWQGSNFTGGSSGGPWIVNFRTRNTALSGGAVQGAESMLAVIGVTSWGSADPNAIKDNWSSQFRQNARYPNASYGIYGAGNIGALVNRLCKGPGPGGGTLASEGYCN